MNDIDKLKQLTLNLPGVIQHEGKSYYEYDTPGGFSLGLSLYKDREVAIQRVVIPSGESFPTHSHGITEYIIVVTGKFTLTHQNKQRVLRAKDVAVIGPNEFHSGKMNADTDLISITIPIKED